MEKARQKELFTTEQRKEIPFAKKEKKKGGVIPDIPAGVTIYGAPTYSSPLIRRTEEGESFPWGRAVPNKEEMVLWFEGRRGRDYVEYLPTVLGRKKGEEIIFYGDLRQEIRRKPKKQKLQPELPMPTKEK